VEAEGDQPRGGGDWNPRPRRACQEILRRSSVYIRRRAIAPDKAAAIRTDVAVAISAAIVTMHI